MFVVARSISVHFWGRLYFLNVFGIHLKRNFVAVKSQLKYIQKLEQVKNSGVLRVLPDYTTCAVDFVSNDYLGMSRIAFPIKQTLSFSGLGSRLIAGNSREAQHCEDFLAELFLAESALVFNSGYDANLGFFSTLPQKEEVVLYDEAIHASIRDGLRLSLASSYSFAHNDLLDLEQKLQRYADRTTILVVEGVYSMDGDEAPLREIFNLAAQYGAQVVVDEAHSLGVVGQHGLGASFDWRQHPNLLARIITFGKAVGAHGAAVLSNHELKEFLVHGCRAFIYTTALPPEAYLRIRLALEYIQKHPGMREQLQQNTAHFAQVFDLPEQHIQLLPIAGVAKIKSLMQEAKQQKIALKGVWSPTVPLGQERLRISLHAFNNETEINTLFQFLKAHV
jgi:8-amino-7-oxononanoate synthase